jgi:glyoxylase-like metal-dependent hydrolase (beta-lactamase superfamily II)
VDQELSDGESIDLGGAYPQRLRCVHTPGHAAGHLCFLLEKTRFLVAGDMVAGIGTILIDPDEGDMRAYLASLQVMKELHPSRLLPAHGDPLPEAGAHLDAYRSHRLWRESRVIEALKELGAATPGALVPRVYMDASPAIYDLAERSLIAHLRKLAAEGRAAEHGGEWTLTA